MMLKKLFFLLFVMFLFACNNVDENKQRIIRIETPTFNPNEEVGMDNQIEANQILESISTPTTSKAKSINEEHYGGGFIDEAGNLTIMVKGDTSYGEKIVGNKNSAKVKYQKCKYSLAELDAVMDIINDYAIKNKNATSANLSAWCVSETKNAVEVFLYDTTSSAIAEFKANVTNSDAIIFLQGEHFVEESTHLYAGGKMSLGLITDTTIMEPPFGSYGFRAREKSGNHRVGMVTAAHVIGVNEYAYLWDETVGICTQSVRGGSVDAAFVAVADTSEYVPSNYMFGTTLDVLSTSTSLPGTGTIINLRGAKSGSQSGHIINTKFSYTTSDGIVHTNMTAASYESDSGDSGGIIYTYVSSTGTRYTVGIHKGYYGTYKIYSKATNVLSMLNLERY